MSQPQTPQEQLLQILLRLFGYVGMTAFACVLLPDSWMDATHQWLGLGSLPVEPIVGYLARSVSAFYGMIAVIFLFAARDVRRNQTLIRLLGVLVLALGLMLWGIDLHEGMPRWWIVIEAAVTVLFGASLCWLSRKIKPV
jgi:hypothetical protein